MPQTLNYLLELGTSRLREGGIENPRLAAEMMLRRILGLRRLDIYLRAEEAVADPDATLFDNMVSRKLNREPIQYILGETEWFGIIIKCDRRALIPRPETEIVVERALHLLQSVSRPYVADIGTGTGCIAIAVASARPDATLIATDISSDALALARENIRHHSLEDRISLVQGDLLLPLVSHDSFDLIISNPPYIRSSELPSLMPEVRDYEPGGALLAGEDGLTIIRRLVQEAPPYLKSGGCLVLEFGVDHAESICTIAAETEAYHDSEIIIDYNQRQRGAVLLRK